jgi:serine/threonine protein kinase
VTGVQTCALPILLGRGSFGRVELWYKKSIPDKKYAMKIIQKDTIPNGVQQEINILIELNYDSACQDFILCYLGSTFKNGIHYILTDYAEGYENLLYLYKKIELGDVVIIYEKICKAVKFIHDKSIAHLDLKLQNILIKDTDIKIIDFGGSCNYDGNRTSDVMTDLNVRCPDKNSIINTELYCDPVLFQKLLNGDSPNMIDYIKADLWSVGIILYLLEFKESPYEIPISILYNEIVFNRTGTLSEVIRHYYANYLKYIITYTNPPQISDAYNGAKDWFSPQIELLDKIAALSECYITFSPFKYSIDGSTTQQPEIENPLLFAASPRH